MRCEVSNVNKYRIELLSSVEEKNGTIYGIESEKNNKREKKEKRRNL